MWGKGKGVIGKCWENRRPEHVLWAPIAHRYAGVDITEAVWVSIPATDAVKEPLTDEQAADRYFETLKTMHPSERMLARIEQIQKVRDRHRREAPATG